MAKTIYLNEKIIADLQRPHPHPFSIAVLRHQEVHARHASLFKTLRFILFRDYRIKEEILAYTAMFRILKQQNQTFDFKHAARDFSKLRYLWMTSYEDGMALLRKIWEEA